MKTTIILDEVRAETSDDIFPNVFTLTKIWRFSILI